MFHSSLFILITLHRPSRSLRNCKATAKSKTRRQRQRLNLIKGQIERREEWVGGKKDARGYVVGMGSGGR